MPALPQLPFTSRLFGALLVAGLPVAGAYGQVVTAGSLLINLDAASFNSGNSTWSNTGALTGNFDVSGTNPTRTIINGAAGVFLDDSDFLVGPLSTPAIDGVNQTASIEVWVQQGYVRQEETMVSWGKRGGNPDGSNNAFGYGSDDRWGAMAHWGGADIGWGPNDPNGTNSDPFTPAPGTPSTGQWHHLAYTYDGTTQKLFQDGVLVNQEAVSLNVFQSLPIQIAAQREGDGTTVTGNLRLGGTISKVRIHDGALTDAQVTQNFNAEKASYGYTAANAYVKTGAKLTLAPAHRYSFNNLGSAADGTVITDSVGGVNQANGTLRGAGATVAGTSGIDLPGGDSATQAYIDLPNGIISGTFNGGTAYASASYETWVTVQTNQNWSRIMDFGSSQNGEVVGPGGAGNGTNYITLAANNGGANVLRLDHGGDGGINGAPVGGGVRETQGNNGLGTEIHIVMTYDAVDQEWSFFRNGVMMEGFSSNGGPATINDVNNWLGRSQWGGDSNLDGIFNEFRVYGYALSPDQVQGNFAAGPDVVNLVPEPASASLFVLGTLGVLGLRRRRLS